MKVFERKRLGSCIFGLSLSFFALRCVFILSVCAVFAASLMQRGSGTEPAWEGGVWLL